MARFAPHCGCEGATFVQPSNGVSRKTRTGAMSERRVWRCAGCRMQFSVLTGTVFHGTKISLRKWVLVIFEMGASKNGVSAREIERKYGMCPRSAWFMMHRIREAMANDGLVTSMAGVVVADETFIGGSFKNMHAAKRDRMVPRSEAPASAGVRKTAVLSLIDASTGEARSRVVPNVTDQTLRKAIAEKCDMPATTLYTDDAQVYKTFADELADTAASTTLRTCTCASKRTGPWSRPTWPRTSSAN